MVVVLCWASFLQENSVRLASNSKPGKNEKSDNFFIVKVFGKNWLKWGETREGTTDDFHRLTRMLFVHKTNTAKVKVLPVDMLGNFE